MAEKKKQLLPLLLNVLFLSIFFCLQNRGVFLRMALIPQILVKESEISNNSYTLSPKIFFHGIMSCQLAVFWTCYVLSFGFLFHISIIAERTNLLMSQHGGRTAEGNMFSSQMSLFSLGQLISCHISILPDVQSGPLAFNL